MQEDGDTRQALAALCRMLAHFGMDDLDGAELTAVVPGGGPILTNPPHAMLREMRPQDLEPTATLHAALHAARPDLAWIVRTRSVAGIAVSAQPGGLLPVSQHALAFYGRLALHAGGDAPETWPESLGTYSAMLLRRHGLLVGAPDAPRAFDRIYFLERACQAQLQAQAGGGALVIPDEGVRLHTAGQSDAANANTGDPPPYVPLAWQAARRLVDTQ